jgi:hypothetical protein
LGGHIFSVFYGILLVAYLVGGFKHGWMIFHFIYGLFIIPPIDELHHFSRWLLHHQAAIVFLSKVWSNPGEMFQKSWHFGSWNGPQATA